VLLSNFIGLWSSGSVIVCSEVVDAARCLEMFISLYTVNYSQPSRSPQLTLLLFVMYLWKPALSCKKKVLVLTPWFQVKLKYWIYNIHLMCHHLQRCQYAVLLRTVAKIIVCLCVCMYMKYLCIQRTVCFE